MWKKLVETFSSLRLTIVLLILISAASLAGTVIVQNETPDRYLELYGETVYGLLRFTGALDLYHSWYFQLILGLISFNLIVCTLERLPRVWRRIRKESEEFPAHLPEQSRFQARFESAAARESAVPAVEKILRSRFSRVEGREADGSHVFFATRGALSLLGPYVTHVSLLLIIAGALIGSFFGFKGFIPLPEGDSVAEFREKGGDRMIQLPFTLRCDDFTIENYDGTMQTKDFKSKLTVLEGGKEVFSKVIEVNDPLIWKDIFFYQASYGQDQSVYLLSTDTQEGDTLGGLASMGQGLLIDGTNVSYRFADYQPSMEGMGMDMGPTATVEKWEGDKFIQAFRLFARYPNFDKERQDRYVISFTPAAQREWTGLQVAKDPGVPVVWAGCALMMVGIYISFFVYHRRVWVRVRPAGKKSAVEIYGQSQKAKDSFTKQIEALGRELEQGLKS